MKVVWQIIAVLREAERLSSGATANFDPKVNSGKSSGGPPAGGSFYTDALDELSVEVHHWLARWQARVDAARKRPPSRFDGNPHAWGDHVRSNPEYEGKTDAYVSEREGVSRELINKVRRGQRHAA